MEYLIGKYTTSAYKESVDYIDSFISDRINELAEKEWDLERLVPCVTIPPKNQLVYNKFKILRKMYANLTVPNKKFVGARRERNTKWFVSPDETLINKFRSNASLSAMFSLEDAFNTIKNVYPMSHWSISALDDPFKDGSLAFINDDGDVKFYKFHIGHSLDSTGHLVVNWRIRPTDEMSPPCQLLKIG